MERLIYLTLLLLLHPAFCFADDIVKLQMQVQQAKQTVEEHALHFRTVKTSEKGRLEDLDASTKQLTQAIRELFNLQMKLQRAQLDDAEAKIAASRSLLAERQKRAEEVVGKHLQSIVNVPADAASPQAVLDAMERFTVAKDYAGLVGLMTDEEADRTAGMLLQTMSMMSSMMALVEAVGETGDETGDETEQIKLIIASGQVFMRPNPPSEAVTAMQQLVNIMPSAFYDLGATSEGKPLQRPQLNALQYAKLMRQASGVLTDTRAFSAAMMTAASAMDAEPDDDIIPSAWKIEVDGARAVATQLAQPRDRTPNQLAEVELQLENGLWKISKLGSDEEIMQVLNGSRVASATESAPPLAAIAISTAKQAPTPSYPTPPPAVFGGPYVQESLPASSIQGRMQGRWIVESFNEASQDSLPNVQGTLVLQIQGNVLQHMVGSESSSGPILLAEVQGRSSLSANVDGLVPIDLIYDPNGEAQTYQGIIACDGETLSICMASETAKSGMDFRPRLFVPGSKVTLWKCRRASDPPSTRDSQF